MTVPSRSRPAPTRPEDLFRRRTQVLPAFGLGSVQMQLEREAIPDARGTVANPRLDSIERNRAITGSYVQLARLYQDVVDPDFATMLTSSVRPNWFAVGASASYFAGQAIAAAHDASDVLECNPPVSRDLVLDGVMLTGRARDAARLLAVSLDPVVGGVVANAAIAFFARLTRGRSGESFGVLLDPRMAALAAFRFASLLRAAPGHAFIEKAFAVFFTLESTLAEGNRAIIEDIGVLAQETLAHRLRRRSAPRERRITDVSRHFALHPENATDARGWVHDNVARGQVPDDVGGAFPHLSSHHGASLSLAALAVYEDAGMTSSLAERDLLVANANNLLAYREQFGVVQPCFAGCRAGEVDRGALLEFITPMITLRVGGRTWTMEAWAAKNTPEAKPTTEKRTLGERLRAPLLPKESAHHWGLFAHRWPAILDSFRLAYERPKDIWTNLPNPDPRA